MVTPAGFEPGIAAVKGRCPIRLDERAIGVPTRAQQGGSRGEKEEGGCGYALQEQKRRQQKWAEVAGAAWDNHENLVFTTETGRYINNKTLWANFKRIIQSIGMSKLRFHDLRHTFSVNSLQAGDDIKTVQENLGHATAAFTLATYAHATPRMKRESANRMDAFIRSVRENGETVSPVPVP